jgi:hypothetical protein
MRGVARRVLLLVMMAAVAACGGVFENGEDPGWVIMAPQTDEESGIRGLWPAELPEGAQFVAVSLPVPLEEFVVLALEDTDLVAFPETVGSYQGDTFSWALYSFNARLDDLGPETVRVELGLATKDRGGEPTTYYAGLVALPDVYDANEAMFEAVLLHALDALAPLE